MQKPNIVFVSIWWLKTPLSQLFILKVEGSVEQDDPSLPGQIEQAIRCSQFALIGLAAKSEHKQL